MPAKVREEIGDQLRHIQVGLQPINWKPVKTIGTGVKEVRVRVRREIFRVIYVTKFSDFVYVFHVFQKKSRQTNRRDIDIARRRLKSIIVARRTEEK